MFTLFSSLMRLMRNKLGMFGVRAHQEVFPYVGVIVWPLATMSNMAGVWTVTVVTLHRYIAVCLPHRVTKFANLRVARYQASRLPRPRYQ